MAPELVTKTRKVLRPSVESYDETIKVPTTVTKYDTVKRPYQVDVSREIQVPEAYTEDITIQVPTIQTEQVVENRLVTEYVDHSIQIPYEVVETIPDPNCHTHTESHYHSMSGVSLTHQHAYP